MTGGLNSDNTLRASFVRFGEINNTWSKQQATMIKTQKTELYGNGKNEANRIDVKEEYDNEYGGELLDELGGEPISDGYNTERGLLSKTATDTN